MFRSVINILLIGFLTACTTAGPYVTSISSDGNDGLNVEKCMVQMNAHMSTVSTVSCTSSHIKLGSTPAKK